MLRRTRTASGALGLVLGLGLIGFVASPAHAADEIVSTEAELVAAITAANASAADIDTVTFGTDIQLTDDLPDMTEGLTIDGGGFTLDANGHDGIRIEGGFGHVISVAIRELTVTAANGDGISARLAHLTLTDVTVSDATGDGIWVDLGDLIASGVTATNSGGYGIGARGGGVRITDSHFSDNGDAGAALAPVADSWIEGSTFDDNGWEGLTVDTSAGVRLDVLDSSAARNTFAGMRVTVRGSLFMSSVDVSANDQHGIELLFEDAGAEILVEDSTATGNGFSGIAAWGIGVELTLDGVTSSGNGADGFRFTEDDGPPFGPPAEEHDLVVTVVRSTFDDNARDGVSGRGLNADSRLTIDSSTISGNDRGLILTDLSGDARADVVNSTISGNSTSAADIAGIEVSGDDDALFQLRHSTVVGNVSGSGMPGVWSSGVEVLVSHSIIASNVSLDLDVDSATPIAIDYSLIGDVAGSTVPVTTAIAAGVGNVIDVDPVLGGLADNGGPTPTHLPLVGSPAIDAGQTVTTGAPELDQRGLARATGLAIEIGAVELPGPALGGGSQQDPPADPDPAGPAMPPTGADPLAVASLALILLAAGAALRTVRRRQS